MEIESYYSIVLYPVKVEITILFPNLMRIKLVCQDFVSNLPISLPVDGPVTIFTLVSCPRILRC